MRQLVNAARDRGAALVVATHDESLLPLCDRVVRFGTDGTLSEVESYFAGDSP